MAKSRSSTEYSPPVELPSSNAKNFYEEAKITPAEEEEVMRKFNDFASNGVLYLEDFSRLLEYYECCPTQSYEPFFYAFDRNRDDQLDFSEFFLGCCAADPSTVHILNSFTGYERAMYIFDYYDVNRSKTLEFNEFARLTADCLSLQTSNPNDDTVRREGILSARQLGALEDVGSVQHFTCIKFKKFYEFVQTERLRGTSRLFRFQRSLTNAGKTRVPRGPPPQPANGTDDESTDEDAWLDHWLDLEADMPWSLPEPAAPQREEPLQPYSLAPSPEPSAVRLNLHEPSAVHDAEQARSVAQAVLAQVLGHPEKFLASLEKPFAVVSPPQLLSLATAAARALSNDDPVVEAPTPCKVFGSLNGQLVDLLSFFRSYVAPDPRGGDLGFTHYLFLGDYVDRGHHSLEVLTVLLSLKVLYPTRITLLRGHHENRTVNYHLGFFAECERRLPQGSGQKVWETMNRVFEYMSLAAVLHGVVFCSHSGVPASLESLSQLRLPKPISLPASPRQGDLLSDLFSPQAGTAENLKPFLAANMLAMAIRSRQICPQGYQMARMGRLVTVSSCVNYCDHLSDGAILHIIAQNDRLRVDVKRLSTRRSIAGSELVEALHRRGLVEPLEADDALRWPRQQRGLSPSRIAREEERRKDDKRREASLQSLTVRTADLSVTAHEHAYMHLTGRSAASTCSTPYSLARLQRRLKTGKLRLTKPKSPRASKDDEIVRPGLPVPIVPQLEREKDKKKRSSTGAAPSPKEKFAPKARPATVGSSAAKAKAAPAASRREPPRRDEGAADLRELEKIFASPESTSLTVADLPASPSHYLEKPGPSPVLQTLCRLWVGTPLSDQRWAQALQIFEQELGDQGLGSKRNKVGGWTLETFSMWLLKKGRRLRECSQWFKAFDANQDKVISVVDFLQGVVACQATTAGANSAAALARGLALFRLYDSENRQVLSQKDLEAFAQDCFKDAAGSAGKAQELVQANLNPDSAQFVRLLQKVEATSLLHLEPF